MALDGVWFEGPAEAAATRVLPVTVGDVIQVNARVELPTAAAALSSAPSLNTWAALWS
jgi:hypothetical protein